MPSLPPGRFRFSEQNDGELNRPYGDDDNHRVAPFCDRHVCAEVFIFSDFSVVTAGAFWRRLWLSPQARVFAMKGRHRPAPLTEPVEQQRMAAPTACIAQASSQRRRDALLMLST